MGESLNNVLKNAISYINRDPVIKIVGREEPKITSITVKNDVNSISDHELKLIFEKFYRSDKAKNQSSGLGLAIAKEIVKRHGGTLKAESVNGHTTFSINLPKYL